jgi:hypothetical protein
MGMPEDDDIGIGKPSPQAGRATRGIAAVVDHRHLAASDVDNSLFGQREAVVVVTEYGVYWRELFQDAEHRQVCDIAGVQYDIGNVQAIAQEID